MANITQEEAAKKVIDFVDKYASEYTEREIKYLRRNADEVITCDTPFFTFDIIRQIYGELGITPENKDMYKAFIKLFEENFDINTNIVEVAGGIVPTLGKQLAQKQTAGTVTVYDPRVIQNIPKPENLILKKEMFGKATPLDNAEVLIGFMPGEITPTIIQAAVKNEIPFMIALCDGGNRKGYEWLEEDDEWIGHVSYLAKSGIEKSNLGTLGTESFSKFGSPYPIIYSKRKKS